MSRKSDIDLKDNQTFELRQESAREIGNTESVITEQEEINAIEYEQFKVRNKQLEQELENRQVANMNIEGMPWYTERNHEANQQIKDPLSKKEVIAVMWGTLKASLLIGGIFWLAFLGIILFCVFIWFR